MTGRASMLRGHDHEVSMGDDMDFREIVEAIIRYQSIATGNGSGPPGKGEAYFYFAGETPSDYEEGDEDHNYEMEASDGRKKFDFQCSFMYSGGRLLDIEFPWPRNIERKRILGYTIDDLMRAIARVIGAPDVGDILVINDGLINHFKKRGGLR